jgi:type II secretory ATPase GspE/PulE/Tfp pilus assembly ATPase PilB-like protein
MLLLKEKIKNQLSLGLDARIMRVIDKIFDLAVGYGADEIFFEPQTNKLAVDFLVNGEKNYSIALPKKSEEAVIEGLKKIAGADLVNANLPPKGKFKKEFLGSKIIFSLSTHPSAKGEKIIIGLQKQKFELREINRLGLTRKIKAAVKRNLEKRKGIVLVAGDFNAGRTTALYSFLNYLNRPDLNLATVESEIVCDLPAVNQSCLDPISGFSSAHAVNSLKRQDADVAMIGELNDKETIEAAFYLALSGHFVLGGIQGRDSRETFNFLNDLSIPKHLLTDVLKMIVSVGLVEKNCPHCLVKQKIGAETWKKIKSSFELAGLIKKMRQDKIISGKIKKPEDLVFYKSQGCSRCGNKGVLGKIGIFEVLEITNEAKKIIREGHYSFLEKAIVNQGGYLLREDALIKAVSGLTTIDEVLKVV